MMKRKFLSFLAALVCLTSVANAGGFVNGQTLATKAESYKVGMSSGVTCPEKILDSTYYLGYITAIVDGLDGKYFCLPDGTTIGQVEKIVSTYLEDHPEHWQKAAAALVVESLANKFPCKQKQ